jgi:DNA-binding MurR/RpiR family transcriptional regulator
MNDNLDLLAGIAKKMHSLSRSQKRIAAFLLEHYDKAVYMTAARLGEAVGVSESTIVRFASELGFDGYPSLRSALEETAKLKLTAAQRLASSSARIRQDDRHVLRSVLESDAERITMTLNEMDENVFNAAVDEILAAKHVYIMGGRSSSYIAGFLAYYLNLMIEAVININPTSSSEVFEQLFRIGENDVFIAISFPRYSQRTIKAMEYAKAQNATTISITDSPLSPVAHLASHNLLTRSNMLYFVDSLTAPLSVVNALVVAVSERKEASLFDTFDRLEQLWNENQIYTVERNHPPEAIKP